MANKSLARIIRILTGTFGSRRDELESLQANLTRFEKFVHFWVLVWQSFVRNRCPVRASALSYTTLLALVPTLVVAMSLSSIFLKSKGEEQIKTFIGQFVEYLIPNARSVPNAENSVTAQSPEQPSGTNDLAVAQIAANTDLTNSPVAPVRDERVDEAKDRAANYIYTFIQNTRTTTLGATGGVFLIWAAIAMLIRVEDTFNDIWGVTRGRDWWSRITNYSTAIIFGPLLLAAALGLANSPHIQKTRDLMNIVPWIEPVISQLLPVIVISVTFALFYKLMPNTKVHFGAALVGGTLAGLAWHAFNLSSLYLGSRAVNASKIYGSLALVPLLMAGLWAVWVIVLFGAQTAYAFQNRDSYLQEKLAENVNQRGREFVALRLMTCIGQRFERGLPPASVPEMSRELGIPSKLIQQVLQTLLAARLVVEVSGAEAGYTPARPLEAINCHHILLAMRATQGQELITREEPVREEVFGEFARIQAAEKEAASSVTMLALVNRAQARLELAPPAQEGKETKTAPAPAPVELTELPQEPATATAPDTELPEVAVVKETKPISPANISSAPPTAESSTDDNQSFPL